MVSAHIVVGLWTNTDVAINVIYVFQEVGMDELTLITDEKEYVPETTKPGLPQTEEAWKKVEEERIAWEKATSGLEQEEPIIPDEVDIGEVKLNLGETFYYAAWGIRYRFKGGGWRIAEMVFNKKSDAEGWAKEHLKYDDIETEVVPAKRCLELTAQGHTKAWTEELT